MDFEVFFGRLVGKLRTSEFFWLPLPSWTNAKYSQLRNRFGGELDCKMLEFPEPMVPSSQRLHDRGNPDDQICKFGVIKATADDFQEDLSWIERSQVCEDVDDNAKKWFFPEGFLIDENEGDFTFLVDRRISREA